MNDIFEGRFLTEINYLRFLIGIVILIGLTFIIKKIIYKTAFQMTIKFFYKKHLYIFNSNYFDCSCN